MIKIERIETAGWEAAIRGMRNPKNSWERSDSAFLDYDGKYYDLFDNPIEDNYVANFKYNRVIMAKNDTDLMSRLNKGGPVHAKYRRMITVWCDITAPLYWWKEFDTYKVGTVANSCSTMHKLGEKEFTLEDFSCENLVSFDKIDTSLYLRYKDNDIGGREPAYDLTNVPIIEFPTKGIMYSPCGIMSMTVEMLNKLRDLWIDETDPDIKKKYWYQMIQLLPSSYNQKRTVKLNYEVMAGIYKWRKDHKLDEWREFCKVMKEQLPESWIFTGEDEYWTRKVIGKDDAYEKDDTDDTKN